MNNNNLPDNPNIEVIKAKETGLFTNYIFKAIPLAFDESMSYYETLCGLLNYLKNVIIPTVNNNADAVSELQNLYIELKEYVDNYFKNLDVQEEINNKLDEMVEDGTFDKIINQKLFGEINEKITNIENDIDVLNTDITLLIGDSYGQGVINGQVTPNSGWCYHYKNIDPNAISQSERGSGFTVGGSIDGYKFIDLLNQFNIENPLNVKKIVIAGGWNDRNSNIDTIKDAINLFMNTAKSKYVNAKIYLAMISNSKDNSENGSTGRLNLIRTIIPAYKSICKNGGIFINNINLILKNYSYFSYPDTTHPNDEAYKLIAQTLYSAVNGGNYNVDSDLIELNMNLPSGVTGKTNRNLFSYGQIIDEKLLLFPNGSDGMITFTNSITLNKNNKNIILENIVDSIPFLRKVSAYNGIPMDIAITDNTSNVYRKKCFMKIENNNIIFTIYFDDNETIEVKSIALNKGIYFCDANYS